MIDEPFVFATGNRVAKVGGDYRFTGTVVSTCRKLSGAARYVVEDPRGVLHIYSAKNLRHATEDDLREDATLVELAKERAKNAHLISILAELVETKPATPLARRLCAKDAKNREIAEEFETAVDEHERKKSAAWQQAEISVIAYKEDLPISSVTINAHSEMARIRLYELLKNISEEKNIPEFGLEKWPISRSTTSAMKNKISSTGTLISAEHKQWAAEIKSVIKLIWNQE